VTTPQATSPTVSVTPTNGSGSATFALKASSAGGSSNIQQADLFIGTAVGATNSCWIEYWAPSNTLFLRSDNNATWAQATPGSSTALKNASCTVDVPSSRVSGSGNTLTVTLPVTFTKHLGSLSVYAFTGDLAGLSSGWQLGGSWTVR
jgi:hypothetical protein